MSGQCLVENCYHCLQLKQHMDSLVSQLKSTSPESVSKLRQAAWKKFGDDHPVTWPPKVDNCLLL